MKGRGLGVGRALVVALAMTVMVLAFQNCAPVSANSPVSEAAR